MSKRPSSSQAQAGSSKRKFLGEVQDNSLRLSQVPGDEANRSGKLLRIRLINFMCHGNLLCEFNNRVNLIIGSNGSGKSAILTALIVGLGAKARSTSRSTSLKQLVKNGESSADIEITISNSGSDSYEKEIYGNNITICRHIASSGSSTYKIKNDRGQTISKKLDELHKILLYHNIQTDNPVFVLNQDAARTFLKEMEPSKNYQLFLKATQIETIISKLNDCGIMYNDYNYRIECYRKQSELMEKELEELQEKCEKLQSADKIKSDIKAYTLERTWLKVINQENVIKNYEESMEKLNSKYESYKKRCEKKDAAEKEYRKQISEIGQELEEKSALIREINEKTNAFKLAFEDEKENFQNENYNYRKIENKLQHLMEQNNELNKVISERTGKQMDQVQEQRAENEQKIQALEIELQQTDALIESRCREREMLNTTKHQYEENFEGLKSQRQRVITNLSEKQREIDKINSSSKDQILVYGEKMSEFLNKINEAHKNGKFSQMPKGPLGRYITVPNSKWKGAVEHILSGLLTVFIIDNQKDQAVFDSIRSKFPSMKMTVIRMKFFSKVYNVRDGMCSPPEGTTLLMNEIKCSDPVVMNCLIDQSHIETILLTDNQSMAVKLTSDERNVPSHLKKIYLLNPFVEYYPAPLYRAYTSKMRAPRYIQVNFQDLKKNYELEILKLNKDKNSFESDLSEMKSKITEIYRKIEQHGIQLNKQHVLKEKSVEKLRELKSIEYPQENQIDFWIKELAEVDKKIQITRKDLEEKEVELKKINFSKTTKETSVLEQKQKLELNENKINHLKKNIDEMKNNLSQLLSDAKNWKQRIVEIAEHVQEKQDKIETETEKLNNLIANAQKHGKRIETSKTDEKLEELIKKAEHAIRQIISTDESIDDLKILIEDKKMKYEGTNVFIVTLRQTLDMLKKSRLQRFKFIKNLRNHMALRVKYTFDFVLKVKNFEGQINIDHAAQKLTMTVIPRDRHIESAVSNTKSLSGGERSYSTIALLLSLWSCVDHPFYFLDEYDVFTDQVNREIMTKLLLSEAEKKPHRQYSFLTPQDISFLKGSDTLKIHRLAEPQR